MGTDIAIRGSQDLAQVEELEKILRSGEPVADVETDPEKAAQEILEQLLAAGSDTELEQAGAATPWLQLLGVPIEVHAFKWRPSSFDEGPNVFFVVFGFRLDTGEAVVLTTGSRNALAQLTNLAKRRKLGKGCIWRLVQADKETASGYRVYWLERPEEIKKAAREQAAAQAAQEQAAEQEPADRAA
jgi:hypothetical protein